MLRERIGIGARLPIIYDPHGFHRHAIHVCMRYPHRHPSGKLYELRAELRIRDDADRARAQRERVAYTVFSAVVGSITARTSDTLFAGNPPFFACSRTIASFGAMYTQ